MKTSVVIGCLVAVACFAAVDSRAVSSLEVKPNPTRAVRQVSFQTQSDEVKQDKDNKGIWYFVQLAGVAKLLVKKMIQVTLCKTPAK